MAQDANGTCRFLASVSQKNSKKSGLVPDFLCSKFVTKLRANFLKACGKLVITREKCPTDLRGIPMRKLLIGGVLVVAVAAGGAIVAVNYLLNPETLATELKKEVKTRLNRDLIFEGEIKTSLFPKLALQLPATKLTFANSDKIQLQLTDASVAVAVLPLLSGSIEVDAVTLNGLKGAVNVGRVLKAVNASSEKAASEKPTKEATASTEKSSFIKNLAVQSVEVNDASLLIYGLQNKKMYLFSGMNFSTGALALAGTTPVKFSGNFEEKSQSLKGSASFSATTTYDINQMSAQFADLSAKVSMSAPEAVTVAVNSPKVSYAGGDLTVGKADLSATYADWTGKVQLESLALEAMKTFGVEKVALNVQNAGGLKASVATPINGTLEKITVKLPKLTGQVSVAVDKQSVVVPFTGSAQADVSRETANFDINAELQKAPITLDLNVAGFGKPNVTGSLVAGNLVLDGLIPKSEPKKTAQSDWSVIQEAVAAQASSLSALNALNANVKVSAKSVKWTPWVVQNPTTSVVIKNGELTLNNLKAQTCDGTLSATAKVNASEAWSVDAKVSGLNTLCVGKNAGIGEILSGKAGLTAKVSGIGLNDVAIKKTANGNVMAQVDNAVLKGVSLEKVGAAVKAKKLQGLVMNAGDETKFTVMKGTVAIANGQATVKNLVAKSSVAEVSGNLTIGLLDNTLNGTMTAKLATSVDGKRAVIPMTVKGTIDQPSYGFDLEAVIKTQVTEQLKKNSDAILKGLGKLLKK